MTESSAAPAAPAPVRVLLVEDASDFEQIWDVESSSFARQSQDGLWMAMHPGWDDPANKPSFVESRVKRWQSTTTDKYGRPNALFLKAVVSEGEGAAAVDRIVGMTVWVQASADPGFGDAPLDVEGYLGNFRKLFPGDDSVARFGAQALGSMHAYRLVVAKEKSGSAQPAFMVLDICGVHPDYQGRGVAKKLVQWGLEEAQRRGGLECMTEASVMGRRVYQKLGFAMAPEHVWVVDDEFKDRSLPSAVMMRTGGFSHSDMSLI